MPQATTKKIRVFELAKSLNLESKQLIDYCRDLGYDVKNQLSSLETDQVDALKQRVVKGGKPTAPAAPQAPRQPSLPRAEKPMVRLPAPAPKAKPVEAPEPEEIVEETIEVYEEAPVEVEVEPVLEKPAPKLPAVDLPGRIPVLTPARQPEPVAPAPVAEVERVVEVVIPEPVAEVAPRQEERTQPVVEAPEPVAPPAAEVVEAPVAPPVAPPVAEVSTPVEEAPVAPPKAVAPAPAPVSAPAPVVPPAAPPRMQNLNPRPANLPTRPQQLTPARPQSAGPRPGAPSNPQQRPPQGGAPGQARPPMGGGQRPAGPGGQGGPAPRPAAPPGAQGGQARTGPAPGGHGGQQRSGPGGPPPGQGGGDTRHRRPMSQRTPGSMAQPGTPGARPGAGAPSGPQARGPGGAAGGRSPGGAAPAPGGAPRRFTLEELKALREGRNVNEVRRQIDAPAARPVTTTDEGEDDDKTNKKGGPVKPGTPGGEKDRRAAERARRTEQRKSVKTNNIVVEGGQVDMNEERFGSRRGPRAALLKKQRRQRLPGTVERKGKVPISLPITVRSLSEAIGMKVAEVLFKLKEIENALFTINSTVSTVTAELIASEKGVELEIRTRSDAEDILFDEHREAQEDESKLEPRAPVVTIMGHVDHGKTTLLDKIRKTYGFESNVVASEIGGITQVIRAWRVEKDGKPITFLDTPGHEAFTKMRARGANVTDIAVIVVAADSGVQPQTEEALAHAKAANVAIIVAINKVDMPGADATRVERQLYSLGVLPDSMGGDCQFVRTSAVKGIGIDELLETISLVAEIKELKANPHKSAQGTCLEANMTGDEGVMATILVQQGTLHRGDILVCGASFGRVRMMYDDLGRPIKEAGPSVPVRITGLDEVPNADDHFHVVTDMAKAREIGEKRKQKLRESEHFRFTPVTLDKLNAAKASNKIAELKVILKAEARGSVEAIRKELEKLVHDEVRVRVLHAGIGAITESDVQLALASPEDSMIVGFNVVPDDAALRLADDRDVPIREYNIIYELTNDIKAALEGKLKPEERVIHLGRAVVREVFKISKVGTIAGCYVTQGTIERSAKIRVIRDGIVIYPVGDRTASLESLKRYKDDVREVKEGYDCGIKVAGYDDIKVGDVIEAYRIEQVQRTL